MNTPCLPSTHYPDFFKLDLGLGTESVHPLALAIDDLFTKLTIEACRAMLTSSPQHFETAKQRELLGHHGLKAETLSDEACDKFYEALPKILSNRGSILSIEILAAIYFGKAEVKRGLPYLRNPLHVATASPVRLADASAARDIVFVQIFAPEKRQRLEEFRKNADCILPTGWKALVNPPVGVKRDEPQGLSLKALVRVDKRRL